MIHIIYNIILFDDNDNDNDNDNDTKISLDHDSDIDIDNDTKIPLVRDSDIDNKISLVYNSDTYHNSDSDNNTKILLVHNSDSNSDSNTNSNSNSNSDSDDILENEAKYFKIILKHFEYINNPKEIIRDYQFITFIKEHKILFSKNKFKELIIKCFNEVKLYKNGNSLI